MLKKECCKKCWNNYMRWMHIEEHYWKWNGTIECPVKYIEKGEMSDRKITEPPPPKCPYYLENIL